MKEVAREYAEEILAKVTGPIVLYGHCGLGGMISIEAARHLEAAGRAPEAVYLGGAFPSPARRARSPGSAPGWRSWAATRAASTPSARPASTSRSSTRRSSSSSWPTAGPAPGGRGVLHRGLRAGAAAAVGPGHRGGGGARPRDGVLPGALPRMALRGRDHRLRRAGRGRPLLREVPQRRAGHDRHPHPPRHRRRHHRDPGEDHRRGDLVAGGPVHPRHARRATSPAGISRSARNRACGASPRWPPGSSSPSPGRRSPSSRCRCGST